MEIIAHRRNTVDELVATPTNHGVEIDLRTHAGRIILNHEPFEDGEVFEEWLDSFRHGTLILNVKEDGLEESVLRSLRERGIDRFFFLDQPFPTIVKCGRVGEHRCAVRVSEFESVATALAMTGYADWVWVDCFTRFPLVAREATDLVAAGFSLCVVSPELQGRTDERDLIEMRRLLAASGIAPDAVCTKRADLWSQPLP